MLTLAALALAAASAPSASTLDASKPWWEKITMTISGNGVSPSCSYESSGVAKGTQPCQVEGAGPSDTQSTNGLYTKMTFERRYAPGAPDLDRLQPGDTLIGRQVLMLSIGSSGAVQDCRVVLSSGDSLPDYGCEEAKAERFLAGAGKPEGTPLQAFMTILVYGHSEQIA